MWPRRCGRGRGGRALDRGTFVLFTLRSIFDLTILNTDLRPIDLPFSNLSHMFSMVFSSSLHSTHRKPLYLSFACFLRVTISDTCFRSSSVSHGSLLFYLLTMPLSRSSLYSVIFANLSSPLLYYFPYLNFSDLSSHFLTYTLPSASLPEFHCCFALLRVYPAAFNLFSILPLIPYSSYTVFTSRYSPSLLELVVRQTLFSSYHILLISSLTLSNLPFITVRSSCLSVEFVTDVTSAVLHPYDSSSLFVDTFSCSFAFLFFFFVLYSPFKS